MSVADGFVVPHVDPDVDLSAAHFPFPVHVAVEKPVTFIGRVPLGEPVTVAFVGVVREVAHGNLVSVEIGVGDFAVADDLQPGGFVLGLPAFDVAGQGVVGEDPVVVACDEFLGSVEPGI